MHCFGEGSVICNLSSTEKYAAIHELISRAGVFRGISNLSHFEDVVIEREKKLSTGLGHGVAFAHGKTSTVESLSIALGISEKGIEFEAFDGKPVHFLFIVANPPDGHAEYLKMISALSRVIRKKDFRQQLLGIKSQTEIEGIFRQALAGLKEGC